MARQFDQYLPKERQLLARLYDHWTVGQEVMNVNSKDIDPTLGDYASGKALRVFESLGILTKRMTYGDPTKKIPGIGRRWHYTLLVSREDAESVLAISQEERKAEFDRNIAAGAAKSGALRKGKPINTARKKRTEAALAANAEVAIATDPIEEVRAIAGDEPDNTLAGRIREARRVSGKAPDEAAALVEAARQYQGRNGALSAKITELAETIKSLGMTIDPETLAADVLDRVEFEPDPVLETVALVLPYITTLEQRNDRLGQTIVDQRNQLQGYEAVRVENRRLKEQNQRLVSAKVSAPVASARA